MGFSISGGVRAWRFEDLEPDIIAAQMGWKLKEARRELAALRQRHADPAWVDARLDELSVPSLAILATLVDAGGHMNDRSALTGAARTYGIAKDAIVMSVGPLLERLLVVVTTTGRDQAFTLLDPSAARIAARLRDVDLAVLPAGASFVVADSLEDGRALLAACAALWHVDVKLTQSDTPHRAAIKRLAKVVGLDEDVLERLVTLGLDLEVLAPNDNEVLRPVSRRLGALARGRVDWLPMFAAFLERFRTAGVPVHNELVDRWTHAAWRVAHGAMLRAEQLGSVPGVARGKMGSIDVIAPVALAGTAAATITPNFEVFVPPESRHEHLVDVLACAELVRIDRVVVARITKASIQRASAGGTSAASIVAALGAATRTPLPQNVVAAIEDWASGKVAVTAVGRVIVVPAENEARVVAQLQSYAARAIAPGVVVVDGKTSVRAVTGALARIGIPIHAAEPSDSTEPGDADDAPPADLDRLPPLELGDPVIRRRFADYRAGDARERGKAPAGGRGAPPGGGLTFDDPAGADNGAGFISDRAISLVEGWEDGRGVRLPDDAATTMASLLDVVKDVDQRFLLAAKTSGQLMERIRSVLVERGGLEAFIARNRDAVTAALGFDPEELLERDSNDHRSGTANAARQEAASTSDVNLDWYSSDLHARLVAAARTGSTYTLDLGPNRIPTVRIRKVIQRGTVTMVLGEDIADESAIAVPIEAIARIAEPLEAPGRSAHPGTIDTSAFPMTWRPLAGQPQPPGHVPCPCGSGSRYRACCRPKN